MPPAPPPAATEAAAAAMPDMEEPLPWRPSDLEPAMYAESDHMSAYRPLPPPSGSIARAMGRFGVAVLMLAALVAGGWKLNEMGAFQDALQTLAEMGLPLGQNSRSGGLADANDPSAAAPIDAARRIGSGDGNRVAGGAPAGASTSTSAIPGGSSAGTAAVENNPAGATAGAGTGAANMDAADAALARAEAVTAAAARGESAVTPATPSGTPSASPAAAAPDRPAAATRPDGSVATTPPAATPRREPTPSTRPAGERERRETAQRAEERDRQEAARRAAVARAQRPAPPAAPVEPPRAEVAEADTARAFSSPRAACEPRTEFALYRCMQTQCERTQWFQHPQCIRLRLRDEID